MDSDSDEESRKLVGIQEVGIHCIGIIGKVFVEQSHADIHENNQKKEEGVFYAPMKKINHTGKQKAESKNAELVNESSEKNAERYDKQVKRVPEKFSETVFAEE